MAESPYSFDVSAQDFPTIVLENSYRHPVVVDFWAGWCAPCRTLMPILAKLADEYRGKFILAKIDTGLESRNIITKFIGDGPLSTCAVAPDGQTIIAGGMSGQVHFLYLEE